MSDDGDNNKPAVVLTIAGTDPSGGAGINVDLQVCRDFGCHGVSAITAVVWQNTQGVDGWRALEPGELQAQLDAVVDDIAIDAVKIGMIPTGGLVEVVHRMLQDFDDSPPVVLDPVMASGDGTRSMMESTGRRSLTDLRGVVDLVTPNGPEAGALIGDDSEITEPERSIRRLVDRGWKRVLLKGGHLSGGRGAGQVIDWYGDTDGVMALPGLDSVDADIRGTGCQLSTAIACGRAHRKPWRKAIDDGRRYLNAMLVDSARSIGRGRPVVVRLESRQ